MSRLAQIHIISFTYCCRTWNIYCALYLQIVLSAWIFIFPLFYLTNPTYSLRTNSKAISCIIKTFLMPLFKGTSPQLSQQRTPYALSCFVTLSPLTLRVYTPDSRTGALRAQTMSSSCPIQVCIANILHGV